MDFEKEKNEAIVAGKKALCSLRSAEEYLNSARHWGIYDILGGGKISTLIKHSKMNKAEELMVEAKIDIKEFSKELSDISDYIDIDFNSRDLIRFADFFMDGMLADLLVQKRINNARHELSITIDKIQEIINKLENMDKQQDV